MRLRLPAVASERHAGGMEDENGSDQADCRSDLSAAIEELRTLIRDFDDVELADMDERFYVHAFNELDLAGRTIIEAFDRDRAARGAG